MQLFKFFVIQFVHFIFDSLIFFARFATHMTSLAQITIMPTQSLITFLVGRFFLLFKIREFLFDFEVFLIPEIEISLVFIGFIQKEQLVYLHPRTCLHQDIPEFALHPLLINVFEQQSVSLDAFVLLRYGMALDFHEKVSIEKQ